MLAPFYFLFSMASSLQAPAAVVQKPSGAVRRRQLMATAVPMVAWASSGEGGMASGAAPGLQTSNAQAVQPLPPEEPPGMEEAVPPPPPNPAPAQTPAQAPQAQQAQHAPDQAQQHAQAWAYWNAQQAYYQQYGASTAPCCFAGHNSLGCRAGA